MQRLLSSWYRGDAIWFWLLPFSWIFRLIVAWRRRYLTHRAVKFSVPVVVVGNISVGGTGKTPLVIALVEYLKSQGYQPGVISRGYASQAKQFPLRISADTLVEEAGDEPYLIAQKTSVPVVIDPRRPRGVQALIDQYQCNIIVSDDGLQHYRMSRDVEIVVLDAKRRLNSRMLPAGPLREPLSRLQSVDLMVHNGAEQDPKGAYGMQISVSGVQNLKSHAQEKVEYLKHCQPLHAIAGIGNPQRFFDTLKSAGIHCKTKAFPDHYTYFPEDLKFLAGEAVVMTEKDAVKCQAFAKDNWWSLRVEAELSQGFYHQVLARINAITH